MLKIPKRSKYPNVQNTKKRGVQNTKRQLQNTKKIPIFGIMVFWTRPNSTSVLLFPSCSHLSRSQGVIKVTKAAVNQRHSPFIISIPHRWQIKNRRFHLTCRLLKVEEENRRDKIFSAFPFTENGLSETSLCFLAFCLKSEWKVLALNRHKFVKKGAVPPLTPDLIRKKKILQSVAQTSKLLVTSWSNFSSGLVSLISTRR